MIEVGRVGGLGQRGQDGGQVVGLGPSDAEALRKHFLEAAEAIFGQHYQARFAQNKGIHHDPSRW